MRTPSYLMRTRYATDRNIDYGWDPKTDPDYIGMFSATMPPIEDDIVHVDWSEPGWVWVTFRKPGLSATKRTGG